MFKILLVEDDKDLNQTVCTFLNQNGYEAIGVHEANAAYDTMYGNMFDLIICYRTGAPRNRKSRSRVR